jgi:hypothetical protein
MADSRRSLVEGITSPVAAGDRSKEAEFLSAAKSSNGAKAMQAAANAATGAPLNTRIDPTIATALKRASLERKLDGIEPNSQREIIEQALAPWLRAHGYLP